MFELGLSEEQQLVQRMAADFGRQRLLPKARDHERTRAPSQALCQMYADAGFAMREGLADGSAPDELGMLEKVLALEGLAAGDAGALLALDGLGPALYPLLEMGGQKGRALASEISRQAGARGWVVMDSDGDRFEVERDRVRGQWPWLPASELALLIVVRGSTAYAIHDGIELTPVVPCALHAAGSSELRVDGPVLARFQGDAASLGLTLGRLRLYSAGILLGVASASLEHATAYTKERVAFGRPVAHHQAIAFLIAELATRLDAVRLSTWRAAWAVERRSSDAAPAAAQALVAAIETALEVCEEGVQLLGGHGYMQDHPVERWMREARTLSALWGGRDAALELLAESILHDSFDPFGDIG